MEHVTEVELCDKIYQVIIDLISGDVDHKTADSVFNGSGKIIKVKLGKAYYEVQKVKLQGKLAAIPFFEGNAKPCKPKR